MMSKELRNQIEVMAEEFASNFLDAYQCMDWGITPREFAEQLLEGTKDALFACVRDMENDND